MPENSEGNGIALEPSSTVSKEYHHPEMAALELPMRMLMKTLKPHLEAGEYSLLIGDDTSGRIPTLVVHEIADYISDRKKLPKVPAVFVQAGRYMNRKDIEQQVQNLKSKYPPQQGLKALVVTEFIASGDTISRLGVIFNENGVNFDIATVSYDNMAYGLAAYREKFYESGIDPRDVRLFFGAGDIDKPKIYSKPALSGLKPARKEGDQVSVLKLGSAVRRDTIHAREDVRTLSHKLISSLYPESA